MASVKFLTIGDTNFTDQCKNKWRWEWIKECDNNKNLFSDWCKKIEESGFCFCVICGRKINYGSNGKRALRKHANDPEHQKRFKAQNLTCTLPGATNVCAPSSLADRVADQKAMITSFLAENCLPFSLAPKLIDLVKVLANDKRALSKLKMSRTCATYTSTHGTAKCMRDETVANLQSGFFSLNVDEATNNATDKIMNVMVRYYDEEQQMVVTDVLGSRKENHATAQNVFSKISGLLNDCNLSYDKVVSCLMDNCHTMRGAKKGVEVLMRKENPHLLDIHGDIVHIMSNSAKKFFTHFGNFVESLVNSVYYDIQDSPKLKAIFSDFQLLLNFKQPRQLIRFIETRFCQMAVAAERIRVLKDALVIFYYSFLKKEEKKEREGLVNKIYESKNASAEQKASIKKLQLYLSNLKLTMASMSRKKSIMSILFDQAEKFNFYLNFYCGLLPQFNSFVKKFQSEKPMVHLVHSSLFSACKDFLCLFFKPDHIPKYDVSELLKIDVHDISKQFSNQYLNVGSHAYPDMQKHMKQAWMKHFLDILRKAYMATATYMIQNLPLTNNALTYVSALNPSQRKLSTTIAAFDKLSLLLPNVINQTDRGYLLDECRQYTTDADIDELENLNVYSTDADRIDYNWWSHIFRLKNSSGELKYKYLSQLVKALLTVFSGPLVEGTFNIMDDIITNDRTALTVENFEAVSIIKYHLKCKRMQSINLKPNPLMRKAIHNSYQSYQNFLKEKKIGSTSNSEAKTCNPVASAIPKKSSAIDSNKKEQKIGSTSNSTKTCNPVASAIPKKSSAIDSKKKEKKIGSTSNSTKTCNPVASAIPKESSAIDSNKMKSPVVTLNQKQKSNSVPAENKEKEPPLKKIKLSSSIPLVVTNKSKVNSKITSFFGKI